MSRDETLLLFVDLPYLRSDSEFFCQDAVWIFLERLCAGFANTIVLGRAADDPGDEAPAYRCGSGARIEFRALPGYRSQYAVGEVVRGLPLVLARAWEQTACCDAVLLGAPHPWSLVIALVALARRKRVAFLVRQESAAYVALRAPRGGRRALELAARALEALFVALARRVPTFAVGDAIAARYGAPARPIVISTVPADAIRARIAPADPPRLLWVGRIEREKRLDVLLECFARLCARRSEKLELDLVGRGPLRAEMASLASRLGVADRVRFHGYVPLGPALWPLYDAATALVLSSATEGFPQVIVEAMARGVPVVTTAVGGIPGALGNGEALLVPANDPAALAAAIEGVLDDPPLAARLAARGLAFARAHTVERESARLLERWDAQGARSS